MKMFTTYRADTVVRSTLVWVLVAQAVSIFPLLFTLPFWVALIWGTALLWRVLIFRGALGFPNSLVKVFLGILCVGLIVGSYAGVAGVEPMVSFLVCSFVLKLIEMRTQKDALIVLFIGFVAIAAQFLFAQSMLAALYGVVAFWVLVTAWRAVITNRSRPWRNQLKTSAVMMLQSSPMLLVMFVIMPRLGPLWSVPLPQGSGKTGFSDSLELGDIGELVKSYEIAFHVEFDGVPPRPEALYWRGLVLDQFDGKHWRAKGNWVFTQPNGRGRGQNRKAVSYSIVMEPHFQQWLFSLGYPLQAVSQQMDIRRTSAGLLHTELPVSQKVQYSVVSVIDTQLIETGLTSAEREALLQVPQNSNPRTQQLAQQWRTQIGDDQGIIAAALNMVRERFYYTLSPPLLGVHSVDDFLFETQKGFCEHFASSFVLLMRAADIPARIVVGYQGGSFNPQGFLTVRQADAHAWAEVWLVGKGWVSIDPTAAVAPNRIQMGIDEALGASDRELLGRAHWQKKWFNTITQRWDAMGYSWQRWVLNYDNNQKDAFLTRWLGSVSPWRVGLAFVGLCLLTLFGVAVFYWANQLKTLQSKEDKTLSPLLKQLAKRGYVREPHETLADFCARVTKTNAPIKPQLARVVQRYYAVKYQGQNSSGQQQLTTAVRNALRTL